MKHRKSLKFVPMLVIGLAGTFVETKATPIAIDGGWTVLESPEIVAVPTPGSPYVFDGGPWDMNALTPVELTVTDLFTPGDLFEVWNNGNYLGSGSGIDGLYSFATTPDAALGSSNFSHNSWILQPGSHSLVFKITEFAPNFRNTSLAFKVQSKPVPDGGTSALLLGMALSGILGLRKILS